MTKTPVLILIKLMLGLPADGKEEAVRSLTGAYSICMDPAARMCMNVIVETSRGERTSRWTSFRLLSGIRVRGDHGKNCPPMGYSFRTAVLQGQLTGRPLRLEGQQDPARVMARHLTPTRTSCH